jgi:hypothetical protein
MRCRSAVLRACLVIRDRGNSHVSGTLKDTSPWGNHPLTISRMRE